MCIQVSIFYVLLHVQYKFACFLHVNLQFLLNLTLPPKVLILEEVCHPVEEEECHVVYKEECHQVPSEDCTTEFEENCHTEVQKLIINFY
jgi:hypothetical protein